jgi:nickel transport protein
VRHIAAAVLLAAPALAASHDLWIEREDGAFAIRQGHRGEQRVPLDPARLAEVRCRTERGELTRPAAAPSSGATPELRVRAACLAISAAVHHGFWSLTPDGERNLPRTEVAQAVRSWESRAFAKWVDARGAAPAVAAPLGDELELVPVTPLARLRAGDKLTVRVLHAGKPVEGAIVAAGHHALGETDRAGEARVRVRGKDLACVAATLRRPLAKPEADQLVLEASLCFEVLR